MDDPNYHNSNSTIHSGYIPTNSYQDVYHDNYTNTDGSPIISNDYYYNDMDDGTTDNNTTNPPVAPQPGSFYPLTPNYYTPHIQSAPVSALAIDPNKHALYVTGHTVALHRNRRHATYSNDGVGGSSSGGSHRVSMISTHSFPDGALYSACAGHDEADGGVLDVVNDALFAIPGSLPSSSIRRGTVGVVGNHNRLHGRPPPAPVRIPLHAYRPSYGTPLASAEGATPGFPYLPQSTTNPSVTQMGITTVLPFSCTSHCYYDHHDESDGSKDDDVDTYLCTVSPSSVRVHTHGGLLISSNDRTKGMLTGTFHPGAYDDGVVTDLTAGSFATHVTVAGIPTNDVGHNVHCMDLYGGNGLKTVASYAVRADGDSYSYSSSSLSSSGVPSHAMAVTDLATNYSTGTVVAGCSDGTVRLFDGAWRNGNFADCGRVRAHNGGVASVAAGGNLVCATGYSTRGGVGGGVGVGGAYAYPDPHVSVFDIRMLGRGGVAHPFSGSQGGPRFVSFLPDGLSVGMGGEGGGGGGEDGGRPRILVASGQNGGGLQIITPFDTSEEHSMADYLHPPLGEDERITAMSLMGRDLAIGTSHGNVLQYRAMEGVKTKRSLSSMGTEGVVISEGETVPLPMPLATETITDGTIYDGDNDGVDNNHTTSSPSFVPDIDTIKKKQLISPPYIPPVPELTIEPSILLPEFCHRNSDATYRNSVFNSYVFQNESTLAYLCERRDDQHHHQAFGPLSRAVLLQPERRVLSNKLGEKLAERDVRSDKLDGSTGGTMTGTGKSTAGIGVGGGVGFPASVPASVPASELGLDLLSNNELSKGGKGGGIGRKKPTNTTTMTVNKNAVPNPNRLLFGSRSSSSACYETSADPRSEGGGGIGGGGGSSRRKRRDDSGHVQRGKENCIPQRYKSKCRPPCSMFSAFDFASLNSTIYPGWDYAPSMPNAYASPVLLLLYFVPEIRNAMLNSQLCSGISRWTNGSTVTEKKARSQAPLEGASLSAELGFLFHQIESISTNAMSYPRAPGDTNGKDGTTTPVVGAFVPSNFLSALSVLPEASALALLDGEAAAVEVARRPEAFYRFLVYHLDRELNEVAAAADADPDGQGDDSTRPKQNLIDSMQCMNSVGLNEFVSGSGPPSVSSTRSYTVDLAYDAFVDRSRSGGETSSPPLPFFGDVLRYSLCKDARLRAWCRQTKSYETVVQRKIVTSLPELLSLSCACAGKGGEDRLPLWRKTGGDRGTGENDHWLPEFVEVEIESDGNVVTRQLVGDGGGGGTDEKEWKEFRGGKLSESVCKALRDAASDNFASKTRSTRYRLDAVLSFIRDGESQNERGQGGHHVLHMRVPKAYKRHTLESQIEKTTNCITEGTHLTLVSHVTSEEFKNRIKYIERELDNLKDEQIEDEWVLFNGPVVTKTIVEDARAFHVSFKEPCIVIFRQIDVDTTANKTVPVDLSKVKEIEVPHSVFDSSSKVKLYPSESNLPSRGDLIAFDAEFVSVQHEESVLTASGSKVTVREGRSALARMSLFDCQTGEIIIDDHVLPREPVVDCLTRFSGIRFTDLDPRTSSHNLITTKNAYLKMRYLVDRGCIFVGHGLNQDFFTVNLHVPPCQIIDTLLIFHMKKRRFISLRFLVNYLLGRDMQQDVHDSVEDARAAYDLYLKAIELRKKGTFDKVLEDIYDHGQRTDWKVGVDLKGK